jgi:hypothetical protein
MESRVEDGDVWDARKGATRLLDRDEGRSVVKGRKGAQRLDRAGDLVIDQRGLVEARSAVDDTVADGSRACSGDLAEGADGCRRAVRVDERELEARRACVDDENVLRCLNLPCALAREQPRLALHRPLAVD